MRFVARSLLAACLLCPAPARSAESVRTLAIADFAARAPEGAFAESAWLGPAVSELLQAKLQLFGGARVLERQRVRTLVRDVKADAGVALDDPTALVGMVPAEVLIAGSVSVDPKDPRRIQVQARAFEAETAKIVSEAAFSGTGDLAGLLRIAADLAQTLADGLKLSYTPEQLAYAEPAKIDTLRLYIDGKEHLGALRYREAIASFQKALEGNGGRYYAAAHRLQGEAYQALAKASTGEQERNVREEYLKKFKDDALAASGALFDLGLALEANGSWREAIAAYGDYLQAIGRAGETVRWKLRLVEDLGLPAEVYSSIHRFFRIFLVNDRLHFVAQEEGRWFAIDAATGAVATDVPLARAFGLTLAPKESVRARLHGVEEGRAYLSWEVVRKIRSSPPESKSISPRRLSALDQDGHVLWNYPLEGESYLSAAWVYGGRVFCSMSDGYGGGRITGYSLLTLAAADGRVLSRVKLTSLQHQGPSLFGLDMTRAVLTREGGMWDLLDGTLIPFRKEGEPELSGPRVRQPSERELPTVKPGITFRRLPAGDRVLKDGAPIAFLEKCTIVQQNPPLPGSGPLLFRKEERGYEVLEPESGAIYTLYGDFASGELPKLLARDQSFLVFGYEVSPREREADPRYALPATEFSTVLNVFEAGTGRLVAKYLVGGQAGTLHVFLLGRDIVVGSDSDGSMSRIGILPQSGLEVVRAAEVHLRRAACFGHLGDEEGVRRSLARFEADYPRDLRGDLLRMRGAARRGEAAAAAALALRVLSSGMVEPADLPDCLEAVRRRHPEVQSAILTPFTGRLGLVAMAAPGLLVACPTGPRQGKIHILIDVESGRARAVETPEFPENHLVYEGKDVFALLYPEGRVLKVDLLSGERRQSEIFPFYISGNTPVRGAAVALEARANFTSRDFPDALWFFDPDSLAVTARIPFGAAEPRFTGGDLAVYVGEEPRDGRGRVPVAVIERESGRELKRFELSLDRERIAGIVADRETLFVTIGGRDGEKIFSQAPRGSWLRVLALPLGPGGAQWSYEAEGFMAGNPVLEAEEVVFPAWEGRLPAPLPDPWERSKYRLMGAWPLTRIFLDRATGRRLGDAPLIEVPWEKRNPSAAVFDNGSLWFANLGTLFVPTAPRLIFPGRAESLYGAGDPGKQWWYAPGRPPALVLQSGREREYKVVGGQPSGARRLFSAGRVFESIGGGVILVKDFAGGAGMDELGPP